MPDKYGFTLLCHALEFKKEREDAGNSCAIESVTMLRQRFTVWFVCVTPPARPNRKERGCYLAAE